MSTELIRDYASDLRPDTWDQVCGQELVVATLKRYCITGKPPKAILFTGPYGTGKSTLCRLTAMSMACSGRKDEDANPCGHCDSCVAFAGSFASMGTMAISPQVPTAQFKEAIRAARIFDTASLFSNLRRPVPVYVDDLDEHPKGHLKHLKRELDGYWCGFILAATTKPDAIEQGLLHRFQMMYLQPPEMSDVVPWIKAIAKRLKIGTMRDDVAKAIAKSGGMNHRDILKLIQNVESFGTGFTVEGVEKAALMVGMRG